MSIESGGKKKKKQTEGLETLVLEFSSLLLPGAILSNPFKTYIRIWDLCSDAVFRLARTF